jgi:hypothetical protein
MKWEKVDRYAQRSKCCRYSVCAIGFDNGHRGFYESWVTRSHPEGPHLIATNLPSAEEARRLCEEHHAAA